jgi:hypothetical protein
MWVVVKGHAPAALTPVKTTGTQCRGDWLGPRTGLKEYAERNIILPHGGSKLIPFSP